MNDSAIDSQDAIYGTELRHYSQQERTHPALLGEVPNRRHAEDRQERIPDGAARFE